MIKNISLLEVVVIQLCSENMRNIKEECMYNKLVTKVANLLTSFAGNDRIFSFIFCARKWNVICEE